LTPRTLPAAILIFLPHAFTFETDFRLRKNQKSLDIFLWNISSEIKKIIFIP